MIIRIDTDDIKNWFLSKFWRTYYLAKLIVTRIKGPKYFVGLMVPYHERGDLMIVEIHWDWKLGYSYSLAGVEGWTFTEGLVTFYLRTTKKNLD